MKPLHQFLCAVIGAAAISCSKAPPPPADTTDPVLGTWVLNMAKSSFDTPPSITGQRVTFAAAAEGAFTVTSESYARSGDTVRSAYTAKYDGKRYPIAGSPSADSISFARMDARTVERFDTKGPTFVGSQTRIVSPDGKTLTVMAKPMGPQGRTVGSVLIYDRQ